jgi:DNA/RNA endonuclease YhcR with UshA esterase domain
MLKGEGKTISVTGKIEMYKGKPEIVVTDSKQVQIIPIVGKGGTRGG